MDGATAKAQALRILQRKQEEKAAADYHRRQAQYLAKRFDAFLAECKRLGIPVVIDDVSISPHTHVQGDTSGDINTTP